MTVEELYAEFIVRIERNATNDNLDIDAERFVIIFNNAQLRYFEWVLLNNIGDNARHIREFQESLALSHSETTETYEEFKLPSNFAKDISVVIKMTDGKCTSTNNVVHKVMLENVDSLLTDFHSKPSLEWQETFMTIGKGLRVYRDKFNIPEVKLDYYRFPRNVDIVGYRKVKDNSLTTSIDPEWNNTAIDRILKVATKIYHLNVDDLRQVNLDLSQVFTTL